MSSIQARLNGDTDRLLRRMYHMAGLDLRGAVNALAESVRTSTVERFQTGVSPEGKRWKRSIRVREEGGKTLIRSIQLRNSIHAESNRTGFAVGTNTIYAATHQFGDRRTIRAKRKNYLSFRIGRNWIRVKEVTVNIPARPFLGISEEDQEEIQGMIRDILEE